ncbi:MAG: hypothetical protein DHS20C15_16460 [Planctomycetota bacterium]|nr:MAG: hypothetical protein DHS20C15_16460 [Planctomycetota bacterium]
MILSPIQFTRVVLLGVVALACVSAASAQDVFEFALQRPFTSNGGAAFFTSVPEGWRSDDMSASASRLELFEDGVALGPAHASHQEIRDAGAGRYSHWSGGLYFSSSDGSDPNANGREYLARVKRLPPGQEDYIAVPPRDPFVLLDRQAIARAVAGGLPADASAALERRPRLVYWYTIDALRADTAFEDIDGRPLMPALQAFAKDAVRFDTAYAASSFTKISTASMFTGLSPARHRVMHGVAPVWPQGGELTFDLDQRFYTLAEFLRDAGFSTFTHPYTIHVRPGDGMLQGFERTDLASSQRAPLAELPERLFAYEHILGVHGPYTPSAEAREALSVPVATHVDPASTDWFSAELSGAALSELRAAYRAEAVDADAQLAQRLEWIREQGLWDDAVVIVTADHGEGFGEHGDTQHTSTLYEEVVRVPLLIRFPEWHRWSQKHGESFRNRVSLIDVYATLVDMLVGDQDALPYALDGASLGPVLDGDERDLLARDVFLRTTFSTRVPGNSERTLLTADALLSGRLKAQIGWRMMSSQLPAQHGYAAGEWFGELYDVTRDSAEREDLAVRRRDELERFAARLRAQHRPLTAVGAAEVETPAAEAVDPAMLEKLRALGYL